MGLGSRIGVGLGPSGTSVKVGNVVGEAELSALGSEVRRGSETLTMSAMTAMPKTVARRRRRCFASHHPGTWWSGDGSAPGSSRRRVTSREGSSMDQSRSTVKDQGVTAGIASAVPIRVQVLVYTKLPIQLQHVIGGGWL
jgi:hypothetical protein